MKKILSIVMLITVFTATFVVPCFAYKINRATIYGAVMNSGSMQTYTMNVVQYSEDEFVFRPNVGDDILSPCTLITIFIDLGVTSIDSFKLVMSLDRTVFNNDSLVDASSTLTQNTINIYNWNGTSLTGGTSIRTSVQAKRVVSDNFTGYSWSYVAPSTWENKNCLGVSIPFNTFVAASTAKFCFKIESLIVNGQTYESIVISEDSQKFQDRINRLESIEESLAQVEIPIMDIRDYLQSTDGDHYFSSFHYVFANSTLLASMVTIVALFGIIGFIIYGKKV